MERAVAADGDCASASWRRTRWIHFECIDGGPDAAAVCTLADNPVRAQIAPMRPAASDPDHVNAAAGRRCNTPSSCIDAVVQVVIHCRECALLPGLLPHKPVLNLGAVPLLGAVKSNFEDVLCRVDCQACYVPERSQR